mmetsp:Transcript_68764/g.76940  ORF Transcript_68764/g.76940 Transcript_68764/m.76940 type:complete len:684 (-) Transcript_68764:7-2058(-)
MPRPKITLNEKLAKKIRLEEKRRIKKEKREQEKKVSANSVTSVTNTQKKNAPRFSSVKNLPSTKNEECCLFSLTNDSLNHFLSFLSARDLAALVLTCRQCQHLLVKDDARAFYVLSRLSYKSSTGCFNLNLCYNIDDARNIVEQSYSGGDTGRLKIKGKAGKWKSEFVTYARFLESVNAPFVNGRFVSTSPEHTLCRAGGGDNSGPGGSGVVSSGVGKRGALGNGKRNDERKLKLITGGFGFRIRIVQVAAGGGLCRVSHSLLLTSTGRVLSFGCGQSGALGHGFSGGKQLPDILRPKYIEALSGIQCVCIAAGELHSAAVTVDGDLYTWGDGFCGQLGLGDKKPRVTPEQVIKGGLEDECLSNISLGSRHSLAVTEDGEVFSFGLGHFGVLGRSFTPYDHEPAAALVGMDADLDLPLNFVPLQQHNEHTGINGAIDPRNESNEDTNGGQDDNNVDNLLAHLDLLSIALEDSSDQCIPQLIDSLEGVKIVGASAGHRHSILLDDIGCLYSCGSGVTGCLGHGDNQSHMIPMKIKALSDSNIKIIQMSAGVDMSMAVTTTGDVYAWGKADGGRLGLGIEQARISVPTKVPIGPKGKPTKAVDVECGYVHSVIVGLNGTIHTCGQVGVNGEDDGQNSSREPKQENDFNIWHRIKEPIEKMAKVERWKKFGKYEVKGRQKMVNEDF